MTLIDTKSFRSPDGVALNGDLVARILDLVGIVVNRNTIPGDRSAFSASGIRFGATWLTQRGFVESDFEEIADQITTLLHATTPYLLCAQTGKKVNAKVDFETMMKVNMRVRDLTDSKYCMECVPKPERLPHYAYLDDEYPGTHAAFKVYGEKVRPYLNNVLTSDIEALDPGQSQRTLLRTALGEVAGVLTCEDPDSFVLTVPAEKGGLTSTWLANVHRVCAL